MLGSLNSWNLTHKKKKPFEERQYFMPKKVNEYV